MGKFIIYTDGACVPNPGDGGWGFVIVDRNGDIKRYGGDKNTTNNRMELIAVIKALDYFSTPQNILIYSDSQYVVNGFNSWMHTWKKKGKTMKNPDLWNRLMRLKEFHNKVKACWVRGHNGNKYNEIADDLSVIGMEMAKIGIKSTPERKVVVIPEGLSGDGTYIKNPKSAPRHKIDNSKRKELYNTLTRRN